MDNKILSKEHYSLSFEKVFQGFKVIWMSSTLVSKVIFVLQKNSCTCHFDLFGFCEILQFDDWTRACIEEICLLFSVLFKVNGSVR